MEGLVKRAVMMEERQRGQQGQAGMVEAGLGGGRQGHYKFKKELEGAQGER
jgi:hypothetical protein